MILSNLSFQRWGGVVGEGGWVTGLLVELPLARLSLARVAKIHFISSSCLTVLAR